MERAKNSQPSRQQLEDFVLAILPPSQVDIVLENHGSLFLIRGLSDAGKNWLAENVDNEEAQYWCGAVVCEVRYVADIALGAEKFGLVVR
jgi:hypothetical protein